jgi:hypothetical protein
VRSLEAQLPGVRVKGNGMVLGAAAEDGRAIPFELLRVRLGHPRIRTGGTAVDLAGGGAP